MKAKKYLKLLSLVMIVGLVLVGCVQRDANGTPHGLIWTLIGAPTEYLLVFFANLIGDSVNRYGFSVMIVTVIVRLVLLPINLNQSRHMLIQQERTAAIQPHLNALKEQMAQAKTLEEKRAIQEQQMDVQRQAGIKLFNPGCLTMFIQLPIMSALYVAISSSQAIAQSTFFGIPLSTPHMALTLASVAFTFLQGLLSQIGMTPAQKKANQTVLITTSVMIFMFTYSLPAGIALYWAVSGAFGCLQQLYTNLVHKPKIKQDIQEELKKNPINITLRPQARKEAKPVAAQQTFG